MSTDVRNSGHAIPVYWLNLHDDNLARGMWDQATIDRLLTTHPTVDFQHHEVSHLPESDRAVVVVPGRFHAADIDPINDELKVIRHCLLIVTSDEEALFPVDKLDHPDLEVWQQTPSPGSEGVLPLLEGVPYHGWGLPLDDPDRDLAWFFAGQVTHPRRHQLHAALQAHPGGHEVPSERFAGGLAPEDYHRFMAEARVVPCPSGPATQDSFRAAEAMMHGCIPVLDERTPDGSTGYWDLYNPACPRIHDWRQLQSLDVDWPQDGTKARVWWLQWLRSLTAALAAWADQPGAVTVVIPTSPIPSHPSTAVIEETVASVRERFPRAEILIGADGVRPELAHRRDAYDRYLHRLSGLCAKRWTNVTLFVADEWGHQANTARMLLDHVTTPVILFVEHDTPLEGEWPIENLCRPILTGRANVIRLHHESQVLEDHVHLMIGRPRTADGLPVWATAQWSQRPHLASTDYYRRILAEFFAPESRVMIEDGMHGTLREASKRGQWGEHRVFLYHPEGNIRRSHHLDGRGGDSKFEDTFIYAYPGPTPEGSPRATAERTD